MVTSNYQTEMDRKQDSKPVVKVELIESDSTTTDISAYFLSGANFEQIRERAPDEIQAGNFDVVLSNQDNTFSEYISTSILFGKKYHGYNGAKLKIYLGFVLSDGTTEYDVQGTGYIDEIITSPDISTVTIRCRDGVQALLDYTLHLHPSSEIPSAGASNGGNGTCSTIDIKPFKTVSELWTLTCNLGGGDSVATFTVVGATSGNVGTATSGTEFSTGTGAGGIKFTIKAGVIDWSSNDVFTFTTAQHPEWDSVNSAKIIWSVLTGYNWDTDTQENWSSLVLDYDRTQSSANVDVDYSSFVQAVSDLDDITTSLNLKGYVPYDTNTAEFIEGLLLIFIGSLYTGTDGRIKVKTWVPPFGGATLTDFADTAKVSELSYTRTVDEVINYVTAKYKRTDNWEFSDKTIIYDGLYVNSDNTSISDYGKYGLDFSLLWHTSTGSFAENFADRLIIKFKDPPLNIDFVTGLDAITKEIGDKISVTDEKYGFNALSLDIARTTKVLDGEPMVVSIKGRRDADTDLAWGYLGSSANEGDGESPQSLSYDTATSNDKRYCYLSQNGGGDPDYRMF